MADGRAGAGRRAGRALSVVLLLGCALLAAAWLARAPLAGRGGEAALARFGLAGAEVTVRALRPDGAVVDLSVPDGPSATIEARYDLSELARERRVRALIVRDAALTVLADASGARIEGLGGLAAGGEGGGALPFDLLVIERADMTLVTPGGHAEGTATARYDGTSGQGALRLRGDAGLAGAAVGGADLAAEAALGQDGALSASLRLNGAVIAAGRRAEDVALTAELTAEGWRAGALEEASGAGRVVLASARTAAAGAPLALSGEAELALSDGVLRGSPTLTAVLGDGGQVSLREGFAVAYDLGDGGVSASGPLAFDLPLAAGRAMVDLAGGDAPGGTVAVRLTRAEVAGMRFGDVAWDGTVSAPDGALLATGEADAALAAWAIGPVSVRDVPARGALAVRYGLDDGALRLAVPGCLTAPRASALLGDTALAMRGVRLCGDEPLFAMTGGASEAFEASGTLTAAGFETSVGELPVTGSGTRLAFTADADGAAGRLSVPEIMLPGDLRATGVRVAGRAGEDGLAFTLDGARVAQAMEAPFVSPVAVTGEGFAGDEITFEGTLATPRGEALASVVVEQSGEAGTATLRADPLTFAPDGLQPARVLPVLRGVVSEATGTVSGAARAAWGAGPLETSATLVLDDLSFRGPGLTVQRTEGLTGTVALSSLLPLTSAGLQDLSVRLIDLGAIQLPTGEALFALPGDGTLALTSAAFPWMGGRLSVADASLGAGGDADAVLRIEDVEIGQLLATLDVDGLSGEGVIDGALPLVADAFAIRIEDGSFRSQGPGVIRYVGDVSAAAQRGQGAKLAFSALEDLRFDALSGTVSGPLDGSLLFGLRFEGTSELDLGDPRVPGRVTAPVIYRVQLEAPILGLIEQARLSTDYCRQLRETDADPEVIAAICIGSAPAGQ